MPNAHDMLLLENVFYILFSNKHYQSFAIRNVDATLPVIFTFANTFLFGA